MKHPKATAHQRRTFLKSMIATALASPLLGLPGCGGGAGTAPRRLSFALPPAGGEVFTLHVGSQTFSISKYEELAPLTANALGASHFLDNVDLPTQSVQRLHVTGRRAGDSSGTHRLVMAYMSVPSTLVRTHASRIAGVRTRMGLQVATANDFDRYGELITAIDTATALVFHHPELMSMEAENGAVVIAHIQAALPFDDLWQEIAERPSGSSNAWCEMVPLQKADGSPYRDETTGDLLYDYRPQPDIMELAGAVIREVLKTTREDEVLRNKLWDTSDGAPNRTPVATAAASLGGAGYTLAPSFSSTERQGGMYFKATLADAATRKVRVEVRNQTLRFGGLSLSFADANGQPLNYDNPTWSTLAPSGLFRNDVGAGLIQFLTGDPGQTWRYLSPLAPTSTFMTVRVMDGYEAVSFFMPAGATSATLRAGTMGYDFGWLDSRQRESFGFFVTLVLSYVIPVALLAWGTGLKATGTLIQRLKYDLQFLQIVATFGFDLVALVVGVGSSDNILRDIGKLLIKMADACLKLLLDTKYAALWIEISAIGAVENAIAAVPFVGWAWRAASVAASIVSMLQTTAQVLSETSRVDLKITLGLDLAITVNPDLDHTVFPVGATHLYAQLNLGGATFSSDVLSLTPGATGPLTLRIAGVPSGGTGTITVVVTDDAGTIRGKGYAAHYTPTQQQIDALADADTDFPTPIPSAHITQLAALVGGSYATTSALVAAVTSILGASEALTWRRQIAARLARIDIPLLLSSAGTSSTLAVECTIQEQLVPLTTATRYQHQRVLQYANGQYSWQTDSARPVLPLSCDNREGSLCALGGITIAQRSSQLAYAWQSASAALPLCGETIANRQAWTVQSVAMHSDVDASVRTLALNGQACGIDVGAGIVYQLLGPADGSGANYLLDGRSGRLLVRRLNGAASNSLDLGGYSTAIGSFSELPTSMAWHPQGFLVGVHAQWHKIEVLDLTRAAVADVDAPPAMLMAGQGVRPGLLLGPSCVAATLDGRVLVLEASGRRVQAFDVHAMPVPCFNARATFALRSHTLATTYLDMSVDATGHVFVLCREGNGLPTLEIYRPDGSFLAETTGFTAGRMAVDLWRNIYTLNTESMRGRAGRLEPTVSEWFPVN